VKTWLRGSRRSVLCSLAVAGVLVLAVALPVRLAFSQAAIRRQAGRALLGDAQSRAVSAALFLNSRRNEIRDLADSGVLQSRIVSGTSAGPGAVSAILRGFGRESRFGSRPCFSMLVFVARNGEVISEAVADAMPLSLTLETLRSLVQDLYVRPNYDILHVEGSGDVLVLSVALMSGGVYHGQLLALLNHEVLDDRLQEAPAFSSRAVFLLGREGAVYLPRTISHAWKDCAIGLQALAPDRVTRVAMPSRPTSPGDTTDALGVRTVVSASEFTLGCVEPASGIPTLGRIAATTVLYAVLGVGLLLAAFRLSGAHVWRWDEAAAARRERQSHCFAALLEQWPESILLADTQGRVLEANRAFLEQRGEVPGSLRGQAVRALLGEVADAADRGVLTRALQGRQPWFGRLRQGRADGGTLTTETAVLPVAGRLSGAPEAVLVMQRDISTEVQVAERLRQAQKMEAVGVLTDGIAHDFNNLLTVIQGNCALLLGAGDALDAYARDSIEEILRACDRAAGMTRRLLSFSRRKGIELEVVDLNEVVSSTEKMLSRLIRENVDMTLILADQPVMVKADVAQLEQVVINLTVNARDAMPRGGRLTVRVGRRLVTTRAVGANLEEGDYAVLVVEDTGHGMDEVTRRRIFEPFFTTKGELEGTGLGLTTVQSIAKAHGGDVTVQSQVGLGTVFTVWLPLHLAALGSLGAGEETVLSLDDDVLPAPAPVPRLPRPAGSQQGILVLDDEESVLRMIERGLTLHGYRVYPARTDVELLVAWENHRHEVDLLVTDIVMPGMSGVEVAQRLRQDRPDLKVVTISAYADSVVSNLGGGRDDMAFLQKPFTADALVAQVSLLLDGSETGAAAALASSSQS